MPADLAVQFARAIAAFGLGIVLQLFLLLRPAVRDLRMLGWVGGGAVFIGLLPFKKEVGYAVGIHLLWAIFWFVFLVALVFRSRLLPRLQEGTLLIWNCLFVYALVTAFGPGSKLTLAGNVVAWLTVLVIVMPVALPYAMKLGLYAWYLFVVVTIMGLQFRFADFAVLAGAGSGGLRPVVAFINGMALTYLVAHMAYLFLLLPLKGKRESIEQATKRWRTDASAMVKRLSDRQVDPLLATIVLSALGAACYVNFVKGVMSPWTLINLLLVGTPAVISILFWSASLLGRGR